MFGHRYFAARYFAQRYFPESSGGLTPPTNTGNFFLVL